MEAIQQLAETGPLRNPVLVVGLGAPGNQTPLAALATLLSGINPDEGSAHPEPYTIGEFDPDLFYDFTVARPLVHLLDGSRVIEWPGVRFQHLALPDRDLILMSGLEPHHRWQAFARNVETFARHFGIEEVILLAAFGGGTPHTRPIPLRWITLSGGQAERFGLPATSPQYQGPATFSMALGVMLRDAGLNVGALNAIAPFYVGVDPSPHAVRALAGALAAEFHLAVDLTTLDAQIEEVARHVQTQIAQSGNLATFIANLEQQYDEARIFPAATTEVPRGATPAPLDSADILAEVESLLRTNNSSGNTGGDTGPWGSNGPHPTQTC